MILTILAIGMMVFVGLSRYIYQKACLRRKIQWPDLKTSDNWQWEVFAEACKIKNTPNEKKIMLNKNTIND